MTQNIIKGLVALGVVAVIALGAFAVLTPNRGAQEEKTAVPREKKLGGGIYQALPWIFDNGIKLSDVNMDWLPTQTIGASTDRASYTNSTGKTLTVTLGEVELIANAAGTQVASSTYRVRMFATSTSALASTQNFTAPVQDKYSLVAGTWGTSTAATTTNSVGSVPLGGQGVIQLPPDWTLFTYLQAVDAAGCAGASKCEAATSTKRGFDVKVRAQVHFDD